MKNDKTILNRSAIREKTGITIAEMRKYPDHLDRMSLGNVIQVKKLIEQELKRIKEKIDTFKHETGNN